MLHGLCSWLEQIDFAILAWHMAPDDCTITWTLHNIFSLLIFSDAKQNHWVTHHKWWPTFHLQCKCRGITMEKELFHSFMSKLRSNWTTGDTHKQKAWAAARTASPGTPYVDFLLPTANKLLKPAVIGKLTERIKKWQQGAKYCSNRGNRELPELWAGQAVRGLPVTEKRSRGQGGYTKGTFKVRKDRSGQL